MALELEYRVLGQNVRKEDVESTLAPRSRRQTDGPFDIFVILPLSLKATAVRTGKDVRFHDKAKLISDGKVVELLRDVDGRKGDVGFSCSPDGDDEVKIDTLNIEFREYHDQYTDRGIVWVSQGDPAVAHLTLTREAVSASGMVTAILNQAEEALERKFLKHFKK